MALLKYIVSFVLGGVVIGTFWLWSSYRLSSDLLCSPTEFGQFIRAQPKVEWNSNGRDMSLLEEFLYIDPENKVWRAPIGSKTDGASIPQQLWSVVGGPFEGPYRNAAIIHDVACRSATARWEDVHRMFYYACRCGGVEEPRAKWMYWAVLNYGPRWKRVAETSSPDLPPDAKLEHVETRLVKFTQRTPNDMALKGAREYFEQHNPPLRTVPDLDFSESNGQMVQLEHKIKTPLMIDLPTLERSLIELKGLEFTDESVREVIEAQLNAILIREANAPTDSKTPSKPDPE